MPLENKISKEMPDDVQAKALGLGNELYSITAPYLISLTPEERMILPKMADGNLPFVEKAVEFAESNPEHAPRFLIIDDLKVDVKVIKKLLPIANLINKLQSLFNDTLLQAGSEAYVAALAYYKGAKHAAEANEHGAKPIVEALSTRFKSHGTRKEVASN